MQIVLTGFIVFLQGFQQGFDMFIIAQEIGMTGIHEQGFACCAA